jgi:hypothetical protein
MYKLLTIEEKKKVRHEYNEHRAVVILSCLLLIIVVAIVGLFPSYLLSSARNQEVVGRMQSEGIDSTSVESQLQSWLVDLNLKLATLYPREETDHPSSLIEEVILQKKEGLRLTSFTWGKKDGNVTLFISGRADTRQVLISFQNDLTATGKFSNVTLPVSNLAQDKDINFQINLTLAKAND